ncbi:MAG: GH92 family glycosyl hydrolase [Bacteroidales bacterium]|nr:GH92 family glycosyl hydrolase [Bacteroidales bacterium]
MKKSLFILAAAAIIVACSGGKTGADVVNVFNGTDFHGHTFPGATTPFGLVQLSPDTRTYGWDGCSGYHYSDTSILGFSHTHLSGTGCADLGDFLFTPGLGEAKPLALDHRKESARPGYYRVETPGITVELTAAPHVGVHRYSFTGEGERVLLLNANHCIGDGSKAVEAWFRAEGDEIVGKRLENGWVEGREIFLDAAFSTGFEKAEEPAPGELLLTFPADTKELTVFVGLSYSGTEEARANRMAETDGKDFDKVCSMAGEMWDGFLNGIVVEGGPVDQFYTCLYHTGVVPNNIADAGAKPFYSTLSLWDTFRSWNPLQTIVNPTLVNDMIASMLEMYRQWNELPIWPLGHGETGCMIGYHSIPVIADAWLHGIRGFDGEEALEAMVVSSNKNKGITSDLYNKYGYIPSNLMRESVSQTLEFAYDDWCIARMAESLGKAEIAAEYDARALRYRNVFDPSTGFMRGREDTGNWVEPFDPIASTRDYTEAIPWQARFFVPQDVAGHTDLMGGTEVMLAALDSLFTYEGRSDKVHVSDITGLKGQYAHGNEPSHHMAWIYNWLGAPSKSQKVVRELLTEMYSTAPDGVCGNEDCGQMSAWYVLSSLGIYPACPGSGEYILAAPMFRKAVISLGNGNSFTITADHPKWMYISDVTLNGKSLERNFVTYEEIMAGGTLAFKLSKTPDHSRDALPAPYSLSREPIVSTPSLPEGLSLFKGEMTMEMSCRTEGAAIHYTLDGSEPTEASPEYREPFSLTESARIRARAFKEGMQPSPEAYAMAEKAVFCKPYYPEIMQSGCRYTYHRGQFSWSDDVKKSPVAASGVMEAPTIADAPDEDHFGYIFTGYIDIPEDGIWSFSLTSDDGAILEIDGRLVVNNDGSHSAITTMGRIPLLKGLHAYKLVYLEDYEGQALAWGWKAEGAERFTPVPKNQLYYR